MCVCWYVFIRNCECGECVEAPASVSFACVCVCVCVCVFLYVHGCVGVCSCTSRDLSKRASSDGGRRGERGSLVKKGELVMRT